jgi:small multidrug resistance pump
LALTPADMLIHVERQMNWIFLSIAIVSEVIATSALKAADGFSRLGPSLIVVLGYASAFYFLSLTLRSIPVGIAYAVWSGVGIVLVAIIGWLLYGQKLDTPAILGMALIIAGIIVLNVFSKMSPHS